MPSSDVKMLLVWIELHEVLKSSQNNQTEREKEKESLWNVAKSQPASWLAC